MAYFQKQQPQEETYEAYDDYDDGFDELNEDEDPEAYEDYPGTEEELAAQKKERVRLLLSVGNLGGVIVGTVVILLLVTLLLSMINFIQTDINRNFSLIQTKF
ncbi:MAG: hypothetical protein IJJ42_03700 [Clostridia bacterium]|nr:hypothetical protein [Clostridia bacterium]